MQIRKEKHKFKFTRRNTLKKLKTSFLAVLITFTTLFSSIPTIIQSTPVYAADNEDDYKELYEGMMKIYSGVYKMNDDDFSLTPEELRVFGYFVSNFYQPFVTKLDVGYQERSSSSDSEDKDADKATEDADSAKSQITEIMTSVANVDKDIATEMAQYILDATMATADTGKLSLKGLSTTADGIYSEKIVDFQIGFDGSVAPDRYNKVETLTKKVQADKNPSDFLTFNSLITSGQHQLMHDQLMWIGSTPLVYSVDKNKGNQGIVPLKTSGDAAVYPAFTDAVAKSWKAFKNAKEHNNVIDVKALTQGLPVLTLAYSHNGTENAVLKFIPNIYGLQQYIKTAVDTGATDAVLSEWLNIIMPADQKVYLAMLANSRNSTVARYLLDTEKDIKDFEDDLKLFNASQANWTMFIDAFGNILLNTREHQYVMVPAASNPEIVQPVPKDNGTKAGLIGSVIPGVNVQMQLLASYASTGTNGLAINSHTEFYIPISTNASSDVTKPSQAQQNSALDNGQITQEADTGTGSASASAKGLSEGKFAFTQSVHMSLTNDEIKKEERSISVQATKKTTGSSNTTLEKVLTQYSIKKGLSGTIDKADVPQHLNGFEKHVITDIAGLAGKNIDVAKTWGKVPSFVLNGIIEKDNLAYTLPAALGSVHTDVIASGAYALDTIGLDPAQLFDTFNDSTLSAGSLYKSEDNRLVSKLGDEAFAQADGFMTTADKLDDDKASITVTNKLTKMLAPTMFLTYSFAGLTNELADVPADDDATRKLGWRFNPQKLIPVSELIDLTDAFAKSAKFQGLSDAQLAQLQVWAYLALDPTSEEAMNYTTTATRNKLASILNDVHEQMSGSGESLVNTGSTKYDSTAVANFMTAPRITEVSFFQTLLKYYSDIMLYLILFAIIVEVIYIILKKRTIMNAILTVALLFTALFVPTVAIEFASSVSNNVASSLYSKKFMYWEILQHQAYMQDLDALAGAADASALCEIVKNNTNTTTDISNKQLEDACAQMGNANDKLTVSNDYFSNLLLLQNEQNPNFAASAVTIKWHSPKKDNYLQDLTQTLESKGHFSDSWSKMLLSMFQKSVSGEMYVESSDGLYLYRTTLDINNYSRSIYGNTGKDILYKEAAVNTGKTKGWDYNNPSAAFQQMEMANYWTTYTGSGEDSLSNRISKGFIPNLSGVSATNPVAASSKDNFKRFILPTGSTTIADYSKVSKWEASSDANIYDTWGIDQAYYNNSVRNFNNHKTLLNSNGQTPIGETMSISANAVMTESPYYYFNWMLYDQGLDIDIATDQSAPNKSVMNILLNTSDNYFYNSGELRDFLDMSSLFHVVIPYLRQANEPILAYQSKYGATPAQGVSSLDGDRAKYEQSKDTAPEAWRSYNHNNNLHRLYNQYSSWVDLMDTAKYSKATTIQYGGVNWTIEDPLDPMSYTKAVPDQTTTLSPRPMIFSESERIYYGVSKEQLTEVETRILNMYNEIYADWLQLTNYVKFDPNVVGNAMALYATFEFNKAFSQTGFGNETMLLYPQNFELKNFSYDAYLRLAIISASGNVNIAGQNPYKALISQNLVAGIVLILGDFLATMVIPVLRLAALVLMFILISLAAPIVILGSGKKLEEQASQNSEGATVALSDIFFKPILSWCLLTVSFAAIMSVFLSNGLSSVTGELSPVLSVGSPVLLVVVLAILYAVVAYAYAKLVIRSWKLLKATASSSVQVIKTEIINPAKASTSKFLSDHGVDTSSWGNKDKATVATDGGETTELSQTDDGTIEPQVADSDTNMFADVENAMNDVTDNTPNLSGNPIDEQVMEGAKNLSPEHARVAEMLGWIPKGSVDAMGTATNVHDALITRESDIDASINAGASNFTEGNTNTEATAESTTNEATTNTMAIGSFESQQTTSAVSQTAEANMQNANIQGATIQGAIQNGVQQVGVDQVGVDQVGVDQVGVDQVGVDDSPIMQQVVTQEVQVEPVTNASANTAEVNGHDDMLQTSNDRLQAAVETHDVKAEVTDGLSRVISMMDTEATKDSSNETANESTNEQKKQTVSVEDAKNIVDILDKLG